MRIQGIRGYIYDSAEALFINRKGCKFYAPGEDIFPKGKTAICACVLSRGRRLEQPDLAFARSKQTLVLTFGC